MATHIVLDTNIFLHFKKLDHIEWEKLIDGDSIELVIMPVLIRELDKHKTAHKNKRIRKRAARQLSWLIDIFEERTDSLIRKRSTVIFEHADPTLDFKEHRLNPDIEDDFFIAGAIEQHQKHGLPILVATNDFGLKLKVKAHEGLALLNLPEKYQLEEGPDADEKERQALLKKLSSFENRMPKLGLTLADGQTRSRYEISGSSIQPVDVQAELNKIKIKYPKLDPTKEHEKFEKKQGDLVLGGGLYFPPDSEGIRQYNKELDAFLDEYEDYLELLFEHQDKFGKAFPCQIKLANSGTLPASNIDIFLKMPANSAWKFIDEIPPAPEAPKPPTLPTFGKIGSIARIIQNMAEIGSNGYTISPGALSAIRTSGSLTVSGPRINETGSGVQFWKNELKHHHDYTFKPFCICCNSTDDLCNFQCEYQLTLHEAPTPIEGELHFIFDIK